MSNEQKFRCIPQQLSMSESAPVCQHYSYASDHTLEAMLDPEYFVSQHDRLLPGDTIRIVQMEQKNIHSRSNVVIAFANVTVIKSEKIKIDMHVDRIVVLGEANAPKMDSENQNTGITEDMINKLVSRIDERINELSVNPETIQGITDTLDALIERLNALESGGEPDQNRATPTRRWNPGKKEHEAVIGEGEDVQILFSDKDKDLVDEFIANQ